MKKSQQRGRPMHWKCPFEWTDAEVHKLVMEEIGEDVVFATGAKVLLKLWVPSEMKNGFYIPETMRKNDMTVVGKIIGLGGDAFTDPYRFPSGPPSTYGEWVLFRPYEDQKIKVNGHLVTHINDDRLQSFTTMPANVQSMLKLEDEYRGGGG
jgi:hypothetical protein